MTIKSLVDLKRQNQVDTIRHGITFAFDIIKL